MRSNMKKRNKLNSTNVIYQYNCPHEDCMFRNINYIGSIYIHYYVLHGHDWEKFSSLILKPSFRHKAQFGHFQGTKIR